MPPTPLGGQPPGDLTSGLDAAFPLTALTEPSQTPDLYSLLAKLQEDGIDVLSLLEERSESAEAPGTRDGQIAPGEGPSPGLQLTAEEMVSLGFELSDLCDRCQRARLPAQEVEEEIRDAYAMASNNDSPGLTGNPETVTGELMMVNVDQVTARLVTNLTSVKPLIKVDPIQGRSFDDRPVTELARSTESFLTEYVPNEMDLRHLLPQTIHRSVKVGTGVWHIEWEEEERRKSFYTSANRRPQTIVERLAGARISLIENRNVIVWPPTILNWQRDYQIVGHEAWYSRSSWRRRAASWKLTADEIARIEGIPGEVDEAARQDNIRAGVDSTQMEDQRLLDPQVKITELWCHMWLESTKRTERFQVFLHRPTRTILWIGPNTHFSQKHPYFPIRYKWSEQSAWGQGVGHEALNGWAADTAMWNLSLQNLAAGAFYMVVRNAGKGHQTVGRPVRPGMEVWTDDPENDYIPRKLGGDAPELIEARRENADRVRTATGLPAVSQGMGDPTMKSGAGTGSTLALIEQASLKTRFSDQMMREDLTDAFSFILELVAQYGNDGVFYNTVSQEDSTILQRLRYMPPRGDLASMFRIRAMAPSAATSTEARRNNLLIIWGFIQPAVQMMDAFVTPLLEAENPAGMQRWKRAVANTLDEVMRRTLELHEVPGIDFEALRLPEPTPEDEQINMLNQQLQEMAAQLEQLQAQAQELAGGPDAVSEGGPVDPNDPVVNAPVGEMEGEMGGNGMAGPPMAPPGGMPMGGMGGMA